MSERRVKCHDCRFCRDGWCRTLALQVAVDSSRSCKRFRKFDDARFNPINRAPRDEAQLVLP